MATALILEHQDILTGIPATKVIFAVIVLVCLILVWVGVSLIVGFAMWSDTSNKSDVGAGLITLFIGASILGAAHVINKKPKKSKT